MAEQNFNPEQATLPTLATPTPSSTSTPKTIGGYKIETQLATGGMSHLYLGLSPNTHRLVAIKTLPEEHLSNKDFVNQFFQEIEIISSTNHPNIIKILGYGNSETHLYLVMEFLQGITLNQFIIQHNFALKTSIEIILQIAYAIMHFHSHSIIHRDLKPENIMITQKGSVKVIDFGIAHIINTPHTIQQPILGTPGYMSPEQRKNPNAITYASDIYSLGVISFELLIGKLYTSSEQYALLPDPIAIIIKKMTAPNVDDRYTDIIHVITDLTNYLKADNYLSKNNSEKEGRDIWKHLVKSHSHIFKTSPPNWTALDIGFCFESASINLNSYYHFTKFPDQSYLIAMGNVIENPITALAHTSKIQGIIETLTSQYLQTTDKQIDIECLATVLNSLLITEDTSPQTSLHLLYFDPKRNQLLFLSCGPCTLLHIQSSGSNHRFLNSNNPMIGKDSIESFEILTEPWHVGDQIFLCPIKATDVIKNTLSNNINSYLSLPALQQSSLLSKELSGLLINQQPLTIHRIH